VWLVAANHMTGDTRWSSWLALTEAKQGIMHMSFELEEIAEGPKVLYATHYITLEFPAGCSTQLVHSLPIKGWAVEAY
jgi:hypothetical protein